MSYLTHQMEDVWKVGGKMMGLFSPSHLLQTDQIIYCQFGQLSTSRSFLIVQHRAALDAHHGPVVSHDALRCFAKLCPKAVGGKVKTSFLTEDNIQAPFFVLIF